MIQLSVRDFTKSLGCVPIPHEVPLLTRKNTLSTERSWAFGPTLKKFKTQRKSFVCRIFIYLLLNELKLSHWNTDVNVSGFDSISCHDLRKVISIFPFMFIEDPLLFQIFSSFLFFFSSFLGLSDSVSIQRNLSSKSEESTVNEIIPKK